MGTSTEESSGAVHASTLQQQQQSRLVESALLAKLKDMVPIMPRERDLSKLEIINYVIDYIRHLQEVYETQM